MNFDEYRALIKAPNVTIDGDKYIRMKDVLNFMEYYASGHTNEPRIDRDDVDPYEISNNF